VDFDRTNGKPAPAGVGFQSFEPRSETRRAAIEILKVSGSSNLRIERAGENLLRSRTEAGKTWELLQAPGIYQTVNGDPAAKVSGPLCNSRQESGLDFENCELRSEGPLSLIDPGVWSISDRISAGGSCFFPLRRPILQNAVCGWIPLKAVYVDRGRRDPSIFPGLGKPSGPVRPSCAFLFSVNEVLIPRGNSIVFFLPCYAVQRGFQRTPGTGLGP